MRLARPRFTIRLIMIVVAITAVLLSGGIGALRLARQAKLFRQLASDHINQESYYKAILAQEERILELSKENGERAVWLAKRSSNDRFLSDEDSDRSRVDMWRRTCEEETYLIAYFGALIRYHAQLRHKYERAATHPWETVPPDPPEPRGVKL